jgi:hypothetical protein
VPAVDGAAVRALASLRSLYLLYLGASKCDVDALAQLLLGGAFGAQLRDLDASANALCRGIASHAFFEVATACTQLQFLDLESCEQLRDVAITTLARHCGATLETLVQRLAAHRGQHCVSRAALPQAPAACGAPLPRGVSALSAHDC